MSKISTHTERQAVLDNVQITIDQMAKRQGGTLKFARVKAAQNLLGLAFKQANDYIETSFANSGKGKIKT